MNEIDLNTLIDRTMVQCPDCGSLDVDEISRIEISERRVTQRYVWDPERLVWAKSADPPTETIEEERTEIWTEACDCQIERLVSEDPSGEFIAPDIVTDVLSNALGEADDQLQAVVDEVIGAQATLPFLALSHVGNSRPRTCDECAARLDFVLELGRRYFCLACGQKALHAALMEALL